MDEIQSYEIQILTQNLHWANHQMMESNRMLMYTFSSPYMKNKKKLQDFMPLPTDHDEDEAKPLKGEELEAARNMIRSAFNI